MKNQTMTETTNLDHYLDTIESGILTSDADSIRKLCEETSHASSQIKEIEPHLDSEGQRDSSVLRAAIDELQVQLALGKMETNDKMEEIEKRIEHDYGQMKHAVDRLKTLSEEETDALRDKIQKSWMHLKAAGSIARLRLELAEETSEVKLEAAKNELIEDFEKIRELSKESVGSACEKSAEWIDKTKESVGRKAHNVLEALKS